MIHFFIDKKLRILADNEEDLVRIFISKMIETAKINGHDIKYSENFHVSYETHYCTKCIAQIEIEVIQGINGFEYYYSGDGANKKCTGV